MTTSDSIFSSVRSVRPVVGVLAVVVCQAAFGQPFGQSPSAPIELTDATLDELRAAGANELASIRALLAEHQWGEAVDRLVRLAESNDNKLIKLSENRYIPLRLYCHRLIGRMPPPALALYRQRVDPLAQRWYREGVDNRNADRLRQVVDSMFCSTWGDDALLALGEISLERGEYADARSNWERISPHLRGPNGRPLWLTLRDIDLDAHWNRIEPILNNRKTAGDWLAYPDTDLPLATVRARLALVSIRERSFGRAEVELAALSKTDPDAQGHIGGEDIRLVDAISKRLVAARSWPAPPLETDWPTFGGSTRRTRPTLPAVAIAGPAWKRPIGLASSGSRHRADRRQLGFSGRRVAEDAGRPLSYHPVVVGDLLLFNDAKKIYARHLGSGEPALTGSGVLYAPEQSTTRSLSTPHRSQTVPRFTMTAQGNRLYARMGNPARNDGNESRRNINQRLVGLDLSTGGRLLFQLTPGDANRAFDGASRKSKGVDWTFEGAPIVDRYHLYIAMRQSDVTPRTFVACFDAGTGQMKWRSFIAGGNLPAGSGPNAVSNNLLTRVDGTLFYNTNLGVVASLSASSGQIQWIARYDRADRSDRSQRAAHFDRDLTPCVYDQGLLFVAPSDSPYLFALDAVTGQTIWATDLPNDVVHLLGVADGNLIATGDRIWWIDMQSGQVVSRWPEADATGIRGYGRGFIAGDTIYWPTRKNIVRIFGTTPKTAPGEVVRPVGQIDLAAYGLEAGNIVSAGGLLLIISSDKLDALGPTAQQRNSPSQETTALFNGKHYRQQEKRQ